MRAEERRKLTWEDATERFLDVAELKPGERPKGWEEACDKLTWNAFNSISGARLCPARECPPCLRLQSMHRAVIAELGMHPWGLHRLCLASMHLQCLVFQGQCIRPVWKRSISCSRLGVFLLPFWAYSWCSGK